MRRDGATLKQIAETLQISKSSVESLVSKAESVTHWNERIAQQPDSIYHTNLDMRAINTLVHAGVGSISKLLKLSEDDIREVPHLGERNRQKVLEYIQHNK